MEWGGVPWSQKVMDPKMDRADRRLKVVEALKAIHDAGYEHTNLMADDAHHFLYDKVLEKAFFVDFTRVEKHPACHLHMKLKPYTSTPLPDIFGCTEIWGHQKNGPPYYIVQY